MRILEIKSVAFEIKFHNIGSRAKQKLRKKPMNSKLGYLKLSSIK